MSLEGSPLPVVLAEVPGTQFIIEKVMSGFDNQGAEG